MILQCKMTNSRFLNVINFIYHNVFRQGAYYTQPVYAAQPHVIHHTTVVQPNSIPSTALYPAPVPVPAPRNNGMAAMGMVAGTTMAMSAGMNSKC